MINIFNKIFNGSIISFNGKFGFISSELGVIFFHKSVLKNNFFPQKGDIVDFKIQLSSVKLHTMEAIDMVLVKKVDKLDSTPVISIANNYLIGKIKWFNESKGYGLISTKGTEYFLHISNLISKTSVSVGNIVAFNEKKTYNGKFSATKCQLISEALNQSNTDTQIILLIMLINEILNINTSTYYSLITSIVHSDKIEKTLKDDFIKAIFIKADAEYQCTLLADGLILLTADEQTELLHKYLLKLGTINYSSYNKIKTIFQSFNIEESIKHNFIKSAFIGASIEFQCLFLTDGLISLSANEQTELLQKYLLVFEKFKESYHKENNYNHIKIIAQSNNIDEFIKSHFIKSVFEKLNAEYQYKILFEDKLIKIEKEAIESQNELLEKYLLKLGKIENDTGWGVMNRNWKYDSLKTISQYESFDENAIATFLKIAFEKANTEYQCKMFEDGLIDLSLKEQNNLLQKYLNELGDISYSNYDKIKSISHYASFDEALKSFFFKSAFEKADVYCQHKLVFEDSLIDYSEVSKIHRLRLWLKRQNPNFNYLEFVQSAWQLTNDERKLFNMRLKEQAKNDRFQEFLNQIPKAEIIEKTEIAITYKCKWRNLYYKKETIQLFFDKITATEDYKWESAREEWNLLTQEYFNNRRIDDIIVTVNQSNCITHIEGLENIEVKILIAEIRKNGITDPKTKISSSQLTKIIHNVSARNQCINFLASQNSDYNVIDVHELVSDSYGSIKRDISFIFPIPDGLGKIYLIWESAEFEKSKATHIFKCCVEELENAENLIKEFIESNLRTRSKLNNPSDCDIDEIKKLNHFCRIDHDSIEYKVWENRMKDKMPFLK